MAFFSLLGASFTFINNTRQYTVLPKKIIHYTKQQISYGCVYIYFLESFSFTQISNYLSKRKKIYFSLYLNRVKFRYSTQCCSLKILRAYKEQHLKYMYLRFVYLNNNVEKIELSKVYMSISKEINNLFFFLAKISCLIPEVYILVP